MATSDGFHLMSWIARFGFANANKDNFVSIQKQLNNLYPDLTLTVNEAILAQNVILLRQSSMPLSPLKPEYPTNKGKSKIRTSQIFKEGVLEWIRIICFAICDFILAPYYFNIGLFFVCITHRWGFYVILSSSLHF